MNTVYKMVTVLLFISFLAFIAFSIVIAATYDTPRGVNVSFMIRADVISLLLIILFAVLKDTFSSSY